MKDGRTLRAVVLAGVLSMSGTASAWRPMTIDDTDTMDPGQFLLDGGAEYEREADSKHWDFPFSLTRGFLPGFEIGAGFGGQSEERTEVSDDNGIGETHKEYGSGDLTFGAKWRFIESCPLGARHALAATVKLPTADDQRGLGSGKTDYDLTWVASRSIGEKTGVHLNLGYSWIGGPDADVLHYGVALDYKIADAIQWVGEVFADKELAGGTDTAVQYSTGFRLSPAKSLTLDIAAGSRIGGDAPDFTATVGLTWEFGFKKQESR